MKNIKIDSNDYFPSGELISPWFYNHEEKSINKLGKIYNIFDYNILPNKFITNKVQNLVDLIYQNGGGILYFPRGTYLLGAIFLKDKVHLYLEDGTIILGSDNINDFPLMDTRIEGECCQYYPALINIANSSKTYIFGSGIIDGNGLSYWKQFWLDQKNNPQSTNKDTHRPRLLFVSNSNNVQINGIRFQNSPYWTTHFYKCKNLKILNCSFCSPKEPVPAPSTDGIDLDVCENVLVKNCYFEVNDDAIALKGGKGTYADLDKSNGPNRKIIIEDCKYGYCHSALTFGSESIHNKDIIIRNIELNDILQFIHFKMRGDTPQHFEYVDVKNIKGTILHNFVNINPWNQYFNLKDRKNMGISQINNISFSNVDVISGCNLNIFKNDKLYLLSDFEFNNVNVTIK